MFEIGLVFQFAIWVVVILVFLRNKASSIFHPLFYYLVFHGVVFVLRPILGDLLGLHQVADYMSFYPSDGEKVRALAVSSVALVVFALFSLRVGKVTPVFAERVARKPTKSESSAVWVTWLILAPLAIYSVVYAIGGSSFDGSGRVQMERVGGVAGYTNTTGYIVDASQMLMPLVLLPIVFGRRKWIAYMPAVAFIAYRVFMGWGRWTIVDFVLVVFLAQLWLRGQKWPKRQSVFAAVIVIPTLFFLFAALGDNRELARSYFANSPSAQHLLDQRSWLEKFDNLDFANFDYLTLVVSVVPKSTLTYTYGTQYLQIFTEPIPRILWQSKPYGPPIKFFDLNDYANFIGLTVSLPGDGWMSGGWLGVVITMALAGALLGRLHKWFWRNQRSKAKVLVYLVTLAVLSQLFRDGGISIFKFMLFTSIPIFFWALTTQAIDRIKAKNGSAVASQVPAARLARNRLVKSARS